MRMSTRHEGPSTLNHDVLPTRALRVAHSGLPSVDAPDINSFYYAQYSEG